MFHVIIGGVNYGFNGLVIWRGCIWSKWKNIEVKKDGDTCKLTNNSVQWKSSNKIKDGTYKIGIRPHNITTYKEGNNSVEINGKVQISELSGSESLIHFTNGNLNWVSLSNGIQQKNVGDNTKLYMNTDEFLYFDQNNRLVNNG